MSILNLLQISTPDTALTSSKAGKVNGIEQSTLGESSIGLQDAGENKPFDSLLSMILGEEQQSAADGQNLVDPTLLSLHKNNVENSTNELVEDSKLPTGLFAKNNTSGEKAALIQTEGDFPVAPKNTQVNSALLDKLVKSTKSEVATNKQQINGQKTTLFTQQLKIGSSEVNPNGEIASKLQKQSMVPSSQQEQPNGEIVPFTSTQKKTIGKKQSVKQYAKFNKDSSSIVKLIQRDELQAPTSIKEGKSANMSFSAESETKNLLGEQLEDKHHNVKSYSSDNVHSLSSLAPKHSQLATTKTVMLNIDNIENINTNQLIDKISTYIEQNNLAHNQNLHLTVQHSELGKFDISVQHQANEGMTVLINASTKEGHSFFQTHQHELATKLSSVGIQLNDLKVMGKMAHLDSGFNNNSTSQEGNAQRGWSSFSQGTSDQQSGAERRRTLWEEYRERYYA